MEISETPPAGLTERQQYWLDHITRCDAADSSTKASCCFYPVIGQCSVTQPFRKVA